MVRCAQFASIFRLALVLGALISPTCSALAADRSSDLLQRLYEWRARAEALQPAAGIYTPGDAVVWGFSGMRAQSAATGDCSPTDQLHGTCVPRPTTMAQVTPPPGAPPRPRAGTCRLAAGGQCCTKYAGATLCTPAVGTCPRGSICCSQAQRASGACVVTPPAPPTGRPPPSANTCQILAGRAVLCRLPRLHLVHATADDRRMS
jgi:hypothetical protein